MRYDATFLMPSVKDYDQFGRKVVDFLYSQNINRTFEVIVCHPNYINDNRIRYVPDNKAEGATSALNKISRLSRGDYIFTLVDDQVPHGDIFGAIDFLESVSFKDKRFKITTFPGGFSDAISYYGVIEDSPRGICQTLKNLDAFMVLPKFPVMCFPIVQKETFVKELNSCIFNPLLKYLGDVWLGAFLHFNGESGQQYNGCKMKSLGNTEQGMNFDPILGRNAKKFEGESFVNLYRLCKNYQPGMSYNYGYNLWIDNNEILENIQ